ncbi:MAG TPA: hypothetical protein VH352_20855, partial [Pseudonocardiaceae bacterium]|nr:hypothetical protein [Pseudonocardiaceae bacterium]
MEARQVPEHGSRARDFSDLDGSVFERGTYAPGRFDSTGFGGDRSRGLLTPRDSSSLAVDLMEDDAAPPPGHEPASGVEDYPGVARLSGMWEADAAAAPVEQTWGSDSG